MSENWQHKFRVEDIGERSTITNLRPGDRIARVVTELQDKAVTRITGSGRIEVEKTKKNTFKISIRGAAESDDSSSDDSSGGGIDSASLQLAGSTLDLLVDGVTVSSVPVVDITVLVKGGIIT